MGAWIGGAPAALDDAVAAAAALLGRARAPVVAGLAADVAGIQAALRLAGDLGASLDPVGADGLYADIAALAASGAVTTTPRETIARADLILAVGARAAHSALMAEAEASRPSVGRAAGAERRILRLGAGSNQDRMELEGHLGALRAITGGRMAGSAPHTELAGALRAAQFGVLLHDPAELGELAVGMAHGLAADLCAQTRFFALSLAEDGTGRAVQQVSAWHVGQPPRLGFGRGRPEHDPWRFDAARQADAGEADVALWLAALPAPRPPWSAALPLVALLGEAEGSEGAVVIRVAVPGESAGGVLWDAGTGQLAFRPARTDGDVPEAAAVLSAIGRDASAGRDRPC